MPVKLYPGSSISDLERAVESAERNGRVAQVIGQYGGQWALLVEKKPGRPAKEVRPA
jgi:hypothetical protein